MLTINSQEAKTHLSALLTRVESTGEIVLICRHGKPVAALSRPPENAVQDPLAIHPELIGRILYDPTEPATETDWPAAAR